VTSPESDDVVPEEEQEEIVDATEFFFGPLDPVDWAAELNRRLSGATIKLAAARSNYANQSRDSTNEIEADAKTQIRLTVTDYLSEIFLMLHAMPAFQRQPPILEALKFVVTEIASLEKGAVPSWLIAYPSKQHFKSTTKEAEWVPLILALELLCMLPDFSNPHAAASEISRRTGRPLGTVKRWHRKLHNGGKSGKTADFERPYAASVIRTEVQSFKVLRKAAEPASYRGLVEKRVQELLA
jgi:hypothetical protein